MNKILFGLLLCSLPVIATAQETFDALKNSETELRGTARFQSMAGAFGALGGDLSTLSQNPGGIGVYRSSDAGITMSLDFNSSKTNLSSDNDTRFNVNNAGYVGTIRTGSEVVPYFNIGFTYQRQMDFHRHYRGTVGALNTSITNHIASYTGNYNESDLGVTNDYNPYYSTSAPWASILSYNSYLINYNNGGWQGLYGDGTTGSGEFEVDQSGHTDEYNISFGGNVNNTVFWGATVGLTDLDYKSYTYYGETLNNAYIYDHNGNTGIVDGTADYGYENYLHTEGTGYNFKLGVIVKPVNELRLGLAFHTPTYYDMKDRYASSAAFQMTPAGATDGGYYGTNYAGYGDGSMDEVRYDIHTPWHFIASIAGVMGREGILSFDYEYVGNGSIRVCDDNGHAYTDVTDRVKDYLQASHIFRVGGEYRVTPDWSLRAGYSYQTSPVKDVVKDNQANITTVSNNTAYEFDKSIQHLTLGLGYHYKGFYADMAYVHKWRTSQYNAFSPIVGIGYTEPGVNAEVKDNSNRVVLTMGFRF